jgi:hypothetical protein
MFASVAQATAKDFSRKGAKAQSSDLQPLEGASIAPLRLCVRNLLQDSGSITIEILQVLDLPLNVHEASLIKAKKGYLLKLSLSNSSDSRMIGLRYSLIAIDFKSRVQPLVNRTEGVSIPAYEKKSLTFETPIRFRAKDEPRLVLMLEQVISRESIWEVVKAKDALDSYAKGDYSVIPTVLRVANQVDAPAATPRIFRKQ